MKRIYQALVGFLGSKVFFWIIIGLFALQACWIAISFRYPMIYDEGFHVPVVQIFSHQWLPYISHQPQSYDQYGNLSNGAAGIYHYLMSFPLRFTRLFTHSLAIQIIVLRLIDIGMVIVGLVIYAKVFRRIGVGAIGANLALFIFTMLPIVPFVAAHVSYDNMLFPLTAAFLYIAIGILRAKKLDSKQLVWLVSLGSITTLVKFTFLPIFALSGIYIVVVLWFRYKRDLLHKLKVGFLWDSKASMLLLICIATLSLGLLLVIYGQNLVRYGVLRPTCEQTMSTQRCLSSAIDQRDRQARATRNDRPMMPIVDYTSLWSVTMVRWTGVTGVQTTTGSVAFATPPPVLYTGMALIIFGLVVNILLAWRTLAKNVAWYYLVAVTAILVLSVFAIDLHSYVSTHMPMAIQPRYLLSVAPIPIAIGVVASAEVIKNKTSRIVVLIIVAMLLTQGGGAITPIMRANSTWYWQNDLIIKVNQAAKKMIGPFVKEEYGKYGI